MDFSRIKHIDDTTRLLVHGFIRNIEKEPVADTITPEAIITICLLFYYMKIINLALPPVFQCDQDIWYYAKQEFIILLPDDRLKVHLVAKYDINKGKWRKLTELPDSIKCKSSGASLAIDNDNDLLYLFGGWYGIFALYNFAAKTWNVIHEPGGCRKMDGNGAGLVLPNGEVQAVYLNERKNNHVRWNKETKKLESISKTSIFNNSYLDAINFVYIASKQWLMQIGGYLGMDNGGYTDKIWFTEYEPNKADYKWHLFPLKLKDETPVKVVVAFDCVVIAMGNESHKEWQIWILDLGVDNEEYEWVESKLEKDDYPGTGATMILTKNGYLHFVNAWSGTSTHFKIHLSAFLPIDIYEKYSG